MSRDSQSKDDSPKTMICGFTAWPPPKTLLHFWLTPRSSLVLTPQLIHLMISHRSSHQNPSIVRAAQMQSNILLPNNLVLLKNTSKANPYFFSAFRHLW